MAVTLRPLCSIQKLNRFGPWAQVRVEPLDSGKGYRSWLRESHLHRFRWAERGRTLDDFEYQNLPRSWQVVCERLHARGLICVSRQEDSNQHWVSFLRRTEDSDLFLAFTGVESGLFGPAHQFLSLTGLSRRSHVVFRDVSCRYYGFGLSEEVRDFRELLHWIGAFRRGLGVSSARLHTVGVSMGAYTAIQAAHYLGAGRCWAFALPTTRFDPGYEKRDGVEWDLARLLRSHNGTTHYRVYFNASCSGDREASQALGACPGVERFPQDGSGHNVLVPLVHSGELAGLFERRESAVVPERGVAATLFSADKLARFVCGLRGVSDWPREAELKFDSLELLQVAGFLHSSFGMEVAPSDFQTVAESTLGGLTTFCQGLASRTKSPEVAAPTDPADRETPGPVSPLSASARSTDDKSVLTEHEIGMPLLGTNNLSECALLKLLGDLQWRCMSQLTGIPSREIVDAVGCRLYATFFFIDLSFPVAELPATFLENDRLFVRSYLSRYGVSMLDGYHLLGKVPVTPGDPWATSPGPGQAVVRMSNAFVRQWEGAGWLKKTTPAAPEFLRIPPLDDPPSSLELAQRGRDAESLIPSHSDFVPLYAGWREVELPIDVERDVNGAGLLYFAHYPLFLDAAERLLLTGLEPPVFTDEQLASRTIICRRSAYYSNAESSDQIRIEARFFRNRAALEGSADAPVVIHGDFRMRRASDNRLMMVSSAQKMLPWLQLDSAPGLRRWLPRN